MTVQNDAPRCLRRVLARAAAGERSPRSGPTCRAAATLTAGRDTDSRRGTGSRAPLALLLR